MATALYIHQRGAVRIYDGSATPRYLVLPFAQTGGQFPLNRPRPDFNLRLNRGVFDGYTHYTPGTDDPVATPMPVTFTAWIENQLADDVIAALGNPYNLATWSVGTSVFVTAAGTGASIISGTGTSHAVPQVGHDPLHRRVHFEWLFQGSPAGTRDVVWRHEECYAPPNLLVIGDGDPVTLSITYWIFGRISMAAAFTAGTDITPALV